MSTLTTELATSGVLHITLNRPERLNALSSELLTELQQLLVAAQNNPKVKALLLTGEGKAFCAGADIKQLAQVDAQQALTFTKLGQQTFRMLEQLGKPSLAAIHGFALGGGCELAMATTMRIATNTATFGQPEVKLGLIPGYGGTQRLARLVGKGRALDLCITGRLLNAQDALTWGLVSEVVEATQLVERAQAILHDVLTMAPLAVASVMKVIDAGFDLPLEDALHLEAMHFSVLCASQDKQEGVSAFLEKRNPTFHGK